MTYDEAVAYLDATIGLGVKPGLDRMRRFMELMGNPQDSYPIIHIAGTNGKTSTARMASALIAAHGLTVGAFTSPHLEAVEERIALNGVPLAPHEFAAAVADVAPFHEMFRQQDDITYFELTAALAMDAFAARAVDAAVFEVGLGGRLDATNVVTSTVAVVTGVSRDHMEYLGDSVIEIATEKVAILDEGAVLVTGELHPSVEGPITARVVETGADWRRFDADFRIEEASPAVGGWLCSIAGLYQTYDDIVLDLHGRHQVHNFAVAVAAVEELFGRALDPEAVREAAAAVTTPGRMEIVGRSPLILLDGAHNPEGTTVLAGALRDEFPTRPWYLVIGVRGERSLEDMIGAFEGLVAHVYATRADDSMAVATADIAQQARVSLGVPVSEHASVAEALAAAVVAAGDTGQVVVTGSLYVVGEARTAVAILG